MVSLFTRFLSRLFGRESQILILGLSFSGKTTILYRLQLGQVVSTEATIGYNVETVHHNNIKFQICDFGGHIRNRTLWRYFYKTVPAMIYVVDSTDTKYIDFAKEDLHATLEEEAMKDAVVLIFANKQDVPGALDAIGVTEALELHRIKNQPWATFQTSAINGVGLSEGLDWLCTALRSRG